MKIDPKAAKKGIRDKVIASLLATKTLSAPQQRRLWARSSTAKHFLLQVIAPELLEIRARHAALEEFVLNNLPAGKAEEAEEVLRQARIKHFNGLDDRDRLKHLGTDYQGARTIWKGVEDRMVNDITRKQRLSLETSAGIEEKGD